MSLGSLVVSLSANTAQFTGAMDKAAHTASMRMAQMQKSAKVAGAAIGAAFVAGAGAASILVKQAIDSADAMAKMAQKAGVSVESLSTLAFAAELSGVEVGTLQSAMVKLTKGMSDANMGTGEAIKGFAALGISVKDSSGNLKDSDIMISEVAAKFAGMQDGANKTALAVAIFGKSGADLIPMLNQGASGLKAMQEEARALGLEIDGSSGPAAERFNDNLTRLNSVKKGFANQIMKAVLPALEGLTNNMVASAKSSGVLEKAARSAAAGIKILMSVGAIVAGVFKTLGESLGGVAAMILQLFQGDFKQAFEIGKNVVLDFAGNIKSTLGTVESIWDESAANVEAGAAKTGKKIAAPLMVAATIAKQSREKIVNEVNASADAINKMIDSLDFQADTFGKSDAETAQWTLGLLKATQAQRDHVATVYEFLEAKKLESEATAEGVKLFEETRTPIEQYSARVTRLNELVQAGAIGWDVYDRALKKAQDNLDKTTKTGEDSMERLVAAVEGWGNKVADTFVTFATTGKLSFKDLANSIVADITRIIVMQQISNARMAVMGSSGGGFLTSLLGGSSSAPDFSSAIGNLFSADGGGYTGNAPRTGGLDGKGGFMAVLHPQETVTDHTKGQRSGNTVNVTINQSFAAGTSRATTMQAASDARRQLEYAGRNL